MKANMLHEVVDPQHETASLNNENTFNSPVSFVSVHLTAEVDQAAEAKQAAEDSRKKRQNAGLSAVDPGSAPCMVSAFSTHLDTHCTNLPN